MARVSAFTAGLVLGLAIGTAVIVGHAEDVSAEVLSAATEAHVDPIALQGWVNTEGVDPYVLLRGTGELPPLPPADRVVTSPVSGRVACIIHYESQGDAHAVNPRSGASGLAQFLPGTWKTTPQGRAGLSVFDPAANRAAAAWMVSVGRASEFAVVSAGLC